MQNLVGKKDGVSDRFISPILAAELSAKFADALLRELEKQK